MEPQGSTIYVCRYSTTSRDLTAQFRTDAPQITCSMLGKTTLFSSTTQGSQPQNRAKNSRYSSSISLSSLNHPVPSSFFRTRQRDSMATAPIRTFNLYRDNLYAYLAARDTAATERCETLPTHRRRYKGYQHSKHLAAKTTIISSTIYHQMANLEPRGAVAITKSKPTTLHSSFDNSFSCASTTANTI